MRHLEIEEKIEDKIEAFFRSALHGLLAHGWSISDRIFKIAAWTLVAGALQALAQQTENSVIRITAWVLLLVLFMGVVTTILNVMIYFQDLAAKRLGLRVSAGWRLFIMLTVSAGLSILGIMVLLPLVATAITEVLNAYSISITTQSHVPASVQGLLR